MQKPGQELFISVIWRDQWQILGWQENSQQRGVVWEKDTSQGTMLDQLLDSTLLQWTSRKKHASLWKQPSSRSPENHRRTSLYGFIPPFFFFFFHFLSCIGFLQDLTCRVWDFFDFGIRALSPPIIPDSGFIWYVRLRDCLGTPLETEEWTLVKTASPS